MGARQGWRAYNLVRFTLGLGTSATHLAIKYSGHPCPSPLRGQPSAVQICSRQICPGARKCRAGMRGTGHMRGAVAIRGFQRVTHFALRGERQALFGYRRPGDVAAQAFQLVPFMGLGGDAGVQGKTGDIAGRLAIVLFGVADGQGLQGEYFAPSIWSHSNAVGSRSRASLRFAAFVLPCTSWNALAAVPLAPFPRRPRRDNCFRCHVPVSPDARDKFARSKFGRTKCARRGRAKDGTHQSGRCPGRWCGPVG